jgi:hypothetical protein
MFCGWLSQERLIYLLSFHLPEQLRNFVLFKPPFSGLISLLMMQKGVFGSFTLPNCKLLVVGFAYLNFCPACYNLNIGRFLRSG